MRRVQHPIVTVVIPAYNEEKTVGTVIADTSRVMDSLGLPYEIIVINDGSTDKTEAVASSCKAVLISNVRNCGKGYSLRKASGLAKGDILITIDSDGEHDPKAIPDLLMPLLNGADVTAGSRFMTSQRGVTNSLNIVGNFFFNLTIMALTGKRITDSQTGFRAMKRVILEELNLRANRYEIETEIVIKCLKNNYAYTEVPISIERRKYGASKIKTFSDGTKILSTIIKTALA